MIYRSKQEQHVYHFLWVGACDIVKDSGWLGFPALDG